MDASLVGMANSLVCEANLNNKACMVYACVLFYDLHLMTNNTLTGQQKTVTQKTPKKEKKR